MAIKAEGSPLSFSEIQAELGGSNPISLEEYYKDGNIINNDIHDPNGIPNSGNPISVFDFYRCARRQFAQWSGGNQSNPNGTVSGSFKTHVFTSSRSFNRTRAPIGTGRDTLHYIVIGGGGGGGTVTGGGGGAGDYMSGSISTGNRTSYYMRIGAGGTAGAHSGPSTRIVSNGASDRGDDSRIQAGSSNSSTRYVTAIGGGGGLTYNNYEASNANDYFANGGSGGGGSGIVDSRRGFDIGPGAGNHGGTGAEREETLCGGGGGGAGGAGISGRGTGPSFPDPGTNAARGGIGIDITGFPGANGYRAGGGTGGGLRSNATRTSFAGGGGDGGPGPGIASTPGGNGGANQGAGGGGGGYNGNGVGGLGGSGGKGIIAVKYQFKS